VAAEKELDFYAQNCPDPSIFLGLNEYWAKRFAGTGTIGFD
jgi:hypothetical protein